MCGCDSVPMLTGYGFVTLRREESGSIKRAGVRSVARVRPLPLLLRGTTHSEDDGNEAAAARKERKHRCHSIFSDAVLAERRSYFWWRATVSIRGGAEMRSIQNTPFGGPAFWAGAAVAGCWFVVALCVIVFIQSYLSGEGFGGGCLVCDCGRGCPGVQACDSAEVGAG